RGLHHFEPSGKYPGSIFLLDRLGESGCVLVLPLLMISTLSSFCWTHCAKTVGVNRPNTIRATVSLITTPPRSAVLHNLASMLGSLRANVSLAAGTLQDTGTIEYKRGEVRIVNRRKLENAACECYETIKRFEAASERELS